MKLWHSCLALFLVASPALAATGASFDGIDASCAAVAGPARQELGFLACRLDHAGAIGVTGCDELACFVHVELQSTAWWYPLGIASSRSTFATASGAEATVCESTTGLPATRLDCYGFTEPLRVPLEPGACTTGDVLSIVRIHGASLTMRETTLASAGLALDLREPFELCRDASGAPSVAMLA